MSSTSAISTTASPRVVEDAALPFVSVIVPTYNRGPVLMDTLRSLFRQDYPADRLEIIVVDNSSSDNTAELIEQVRPESPFELLYYVKENRGPAASRNYGLARARGSIVGFTDSDCQVDPGWVRSAVDAMGPGVGVVTGPIIPVSNPQRPPGFFQHQLPGTFQEDYLYQTANVFYRKAAIEDVGPFNERFGVYAWGSLVGGEDTDLGWRVRRAGYASAFAEGVKVYHEASRIPVVKWLGEPLRAQIYPLLVALHPEMRRTVLWNRIFLNKFTAAYYFSALGVIVGLATPHRWALAAPLAEVYLLRHGVDWRRPWHWWKLPFKFAVLFGKLGLAIAALWYGSIRFRTPVL